MKCDIHILLFTLLYRDESSGGEQHSKLTEFKKTSVEEDEEKVQECE